MIDIATGKNAGIATAKRNIGRYPRAETKYREYVTRYRSQIPYSLVIAHLIKVNPKLLLNPPSWRNRRGFLYGTIEIARYASIDWNRMREPEACAYVWCLELNRTARLLYTNNEKLFPRPSIDFWKCVYLRHWVGEYIFKTIWNTASPRAENGEVYPQLLYAVNSIERSLPGWPAGKLQQEVLVGLEEVFYTWLTKGTSLIDGFGRPPVTGGTDDFNKLFFGS
jgi:hypothetical protein